MRRVAVLLLLLAPAGGSLTMASDPEAPLAPDFELTGAYGEAVRLSELKPRVVALQFWAKWCSSCEEDLKVFESIYRGQENPRDKGFVVLGLGHASGSRGEIRAFAEELGISFPMLLCTDDVRRAYDVAVFPTTLLIDSQGRVRLRRTGPLRPEYWQEAIAELLAETPDP